MRCDRLVAIAEFDEINIQTVLLENPGLLGDPEVCQSCHLQDPGSHFLHGLRRLGE
jgi:hypothetical protein